MPFSPTERKRNNLTHTHTSVVRAIERNLEKLLQEAQFNRLNVLNLSSHPLLWRERGKREQGPESKSKEVGAWNRITRKRRRKENTRKRLILINTSYLYTCCK